MKKNLPKLILMLLFTLSFTLLALFSRASAADDTTQPAIKEHFPKHASTDVSAGTIVTVRFSEPMDVKTINTLTFTLSGAGLVSGTVEYDPETYIATFTPLADLTKNTRHSTTITYDVADLAGNNLRSDFTWNFTTGAFSVEDGTSGESVCFIATAAYEGSRGTGLWEVLLGYLTGG